MNTLKKFLKRSFRNNHAKRKIDLRTRLHQVMMLDREVEGGLSQLQSYVKNGKYWYNCVKSEKGLWWI